MYKLQMLFGVALTVTRCYRDRCVKLYEVGLAARTPRVVRAAVDLSVTTRVGAIACRPARSALPLQRSGTHLGARVLGLVVAKVGAMGSVSSPIFHHSASTSLAPARKEYSACSVQVRRDVLAPADCTSFNAPRVSADDAAADAARTASCSHFGQASTLMRASLLAL